MQEFIPTILLTCLLLWLLFAPASSTYACFHLQSFDASTECVSDIRVDTPAELDQADCWVEKIQAEQLYSNPVEHLLVDRTNKQCHLLTKACLLFTAPGAGLESWLPCLPKNSTRPSYLVFTIRAGVGVKSFDAFTNSSGNSSILNISIEDVRQPDVFRSDVFDNLNSIVGVLDEQEMVVVVYKSDAVALRLTFDVSNTASITSQNWFSKDRLKSSWPITNVTSRSFNYFTIAGHVSTTPGWGHERRFFINDAYAGCSYDTGLLMLMDTDDVCQFAKGNFTAAPRILFNPRVDGLWSAGVQRGDRMSVFVR